MLVNLGTRYNGKENGRAKNLYGPFSEEYIFCKTAEGRLNRTEIIDFIDDVDSFGTRTMKKGSLEFIPYFPSRAVIVAREYTPQVFDFLKKLPKDKKGRYLDGSHVFVGVKTKGVPKQARCYFDVYQWHDNEEPEQISL